MLACVCGNVLDGDRQAGYTTVQSPCACPTPGPGRSQSPCRDLRVHQSQYEQRKALGLPLLTDTEKATGRWAKRWV